MLRMSLRTESSTEKNCRDARIPYRVLLAVLTALFAFRIIMQLLVAKWPNSWLPPFEAWHSEAMPYSVLLSMQFIILALMTLGALLMPRLGANQKASRILAVMGWIYLVLMVKRMVIGIFDLSDHVCLPGGLGI